MARVKFLGLDMDGALAARMVAALRGLYPQVTSAQPDDRTAVQAVVREFLRRSLVDWEARQAPDLTAEIEAARARVDQQRRDAMAAADAASTDMQIV